MKINLPEHTIVEPELFNSANLTRNLVQLEEHLEDLNLGNELKHQLSHICNSIHKSAKSIDRVMRIQNHKIAEAERLAQTDELTRILNRRGFEKQLERALASANRYDEKGVLGFIDLDGFKPVNDTLGHLAGDKVLKTVATLLSNSIRSTDFVGRVGGDEFAVVLSRTCPHEGLERIEHLEHSLNSSVAQWEGNHIQLKASFGTYVFGPGDMADDIMSAADQNMYESKRLSQNFSIRAAFV